MTTTRLVLPALAVLLVAGCAVTPPDTEKLARDVTPSAWSASVETGEIESFRNFWARWSDPVLIALIERAQAANIDVLGAEANLRAARASLTRANAALWPSAELNAGTNRNRANGRTTTGYDAGLSGSWTLNLAGSRYFSASAEEAAVRAYELTLADVREMVAAETAQAYVNMRAAEASLEVTHRSIANYAETAKIADWQYRVGMGSASEAEDALTQLASARARVPQLETSIEQYKNALARLTAQPVDTMDFGVSGAIPVPPDGARVMMPAELLERRPDVRSALRSLEGAVLTLRSAKSDWFPTLGLTGNIGTDAATVGALGASGTGVAGLAAALTLPVLNWGSLVAAEETAAAELDRQRANYVSVLLSALENTQNALTGIESSERRARDLSLAVEHARSAAMLAKLEYNAGIGDYTMVLSTERTLLGAEDTELSNRAERANNYIMLYRAVGGGWAVGEAEREKSAAERASGDVTETEKE